MRAANGGDCVVAAADEHGVYAFGDSELAGARLALLAEVFGDATTAFLRRLRGRAPRLAVDLGCGPGFTTALLDEAVAPERIIGVDASAAFVSEAAKRLEPRGSVICADVLDLPPHVREADVLFARFLLTHLAAPLAAIEHWLTRASRTGVVAVQEVESITTGEPTLTRYLELQRRMLAANGQMLDIGPVIAATDRIPGDILHSDVVRVTPSLPVASRMFAMNFAAWRRRPAVADLASSTELDEIGRRLGALAAGEPSDASITWELREIVIGHR